MSPTNRPLLSSARFTVKSLAYPKAIYADEDLVGLDTEEQQVFIWRFPIKPSKAKAADKRYLVAR